MIQKVTMYQAFCDGCGDRNPSRRLFLNELILRNELKKNRWKVIDGFLYCPDCYDYDEETDSYKPKKEGGLNNDSTRIDRRTYESKG